MARWERPTWATLPRVWRKRGSCCSRPSTSAKGCCWRMLRSKPLRLASGGARGGMDLRGRARIACPPDAALLAAVRYTAARIARTRKIGRPFTSPPSALLRPSFLERTELAGAGIGLHLLEERDSGPAGGEIAFDLGLP